jgi:hypothetical protein
MTTTRYALILRTSRHLDRHPLHQLVGTEVYDSPVEAEAVIVRSRLFLQNVTPDGFRRELYVAPVVRSTDFGWAEYEKGLGEVVPVFVFAGDDDYVISN